MAETKTTKLEREYVIPLRKHWVHVQEYKRAAKAVKAIKEFIARHMKVQDRDLDKVRVDNYLNSEIWSRSAGKPPARIKVKAIKEGEIVRVELAEMPEYWKFHKSKRDRLHKQSEKKEAPSVEQKGETKTEEQKTDEKEKEKSTAILHEKEAKQEAKASKHTGKVDKNKTHPQRMALQK